VAKDGRKWVPPIELDDDSLRGASLSTAFFLARIHGRAQKPQSMVVDSHDFDKVRRDQAYQDFLLDILKSRSCLFVGFSFLDPAINAVLEFYRDRVGPTFPKLHTAIVPGNALDLKRRLAELNIHAVEYDTVDNHRELWRAIRLAYDSRDAESRKHSAVVTPALVIPAVHQYMAFAYAQVVNAESRQPIAALVQDGIVLSNLPPVGAGISLSDLTEKVRQVLRVDRDEAATVVESSVQRLIAKNQAAQLADRYVRKTATNPLEEHLAILVKNIEDRARVRTGTRFGAGDRDVARLALEGVFVWRAWDIAAHFAGSGTRLGIDLNRAVDRAIEDSRRDRRVASTVIRDCIVDLLTRPEERETAMLAEIGRAAFGLQLVLATPRQALFRRHALPETIYLDSNVLMPAITQGHPLMPVYSDALTRLAEAARRSGLVSRVVVGQQFLNEIVSQRRLAIQIAAELKLDDATNLEHHILLYGSNPQNVFIGGYAGWIGSRPSGDQSFKTYLAKYAPFEDEPQLARFLDNRGIATVDMRFVGEHGGRYAETLGRLLTQYESELRDAARLKETALIEHEAQQLTRLQLDICDGHRSMFVSADGHLRRVIQRDQEFKPLSAAVVSHLGLIALVDVMIGLAPDTRSFVKLLWAGSHVDQERAVFDYFVAIALRSYKEGVAMEMQSAAERVAREVRGAAEAEQLQLFAPTPKDMAATTRLLDSYEDRFFQYWREAIDRTRHPAGESARNVCLDHSRCIDTAQPISFVS
jgi:hypothetical protein